MPLSYLEPEIMLKTCSEWRPFGLKSKMAAKKRKFQPGKLPTTILEETLWYRLPASTQNV